MSKLRRPLLTLTNLNGKFSGQIYDAVLTKLRGQETGLDREDIKSLISILTDEKNEKCSAGSFRDLLFCCIPENTLSKDVTDLAVLWMLFKNGSESVIPSKINAVLEWITGLLQFNLIEKAHVDGYYELYYELLVRESCQKLACKLIHMLTRPDDVYRGRVERVLRIYKKGGGRAKHLAHLIGLFKTFKPELVPESVKSYSHEQAFKGMSPGLSRSLEAAQQRAHTENNISSTQLDWKAITSKKNKSGIPLIPTAMYVHLGSELYRDKRRKIVEFLDKVSLASYHLSCEIPTTILSLMLNEGGIHFLATHNSDVHARFSSVLYSCLHSVFIQNNKNVPFEEREHFLKQIVVLEDYMQQGIPVVSRFLAYYIASWNGFDHQNLIYRLLERITLANFEEFNDCILTHLQTLFLSGDTQERALIIHTLSELVFNMHIKWTKQLPNEHLFLGGKCNWTTHFSATVPALIKTTSNYCALGLRLTPNDPLILHVSLCFFETLVDMQSRAKQQLTVIPPSVFYRCLFSLDFNYLARVCSLLLRYSSTSEIYGNESIALLNKYSCDVWNCLVKKKAFSKAKQGYILESHDGLKQMLPSECDSVFSLEYHPTMLGMAQHLQTLSVSDVVLSSEV
ncbi:hypothetical protein ONE63_004295 [Megalurothrips usitatus]|uniref:Centromere protein I-like n=1 Tax=Megalurothrips usitatus TaxID=439358 RepID=A0AAV7X5R3_9NEOP|nr:hypothetical protein ONE63_004295 [Megalurothrips usitatus]